MSEENDLEARKNELFATITLLAGAKRALVGARGSRRLELIERQAQLEADKERLSHEVNSQYMYRNLQAFMNRVDSYDAARQKEAKETHSGIAALSGQFQTLAESVEQLERDAQALRQGQIKYNERLDAVIERLNADEIRLDRKRERIDALEAEVRELRGPEMPPEQRQRYITILMRMIAEWERTHPDEVG